MSKQIRETGYEVMRRGGYTEALPLLLSAVRNEPSFWNNWYLAGQCFRFTNDFPNAISYLEKASILAPDEPTVFLALGIAYQLSNCLDEATAAFVQALKIDPNYDLAYNSLALTQMKQGNYEYALHNYDEALKAMSRRIASLLTNSPGRGIIKHHDSPFVLWTEYAMFGATFIAVCDGKVRTVAWPSSESARNEERSEDHEGLFWVDKFKESDRKVRLFLPNYFNTFRAMLMENHTYSNLIGAKGTALQEVGMISDAREHYKEAGYFRSQVRES